MRNDVVENRNFKSSAITKTPSIDPKNLSENILFAKDNVTNVIFFIDSGCEVSILSKHITNDINHYFKPFSRTIKDISDNETTPLEALTLSLNLVI